MSLLPPSKSFSERVRLWILDHERGPRRRIEGWFAGRRARRALVLTWVGVTFAGAGLLLLVRLQGVLGPAVTLAGGAEGELVVD